MNKSIKYKSKLIIDRDECEITARSHITGTDLVNTQCFELMEENMQLLFDFVSSEKVNEYEAIPDNEKTSTGSRDGWYTNYKLIFQDGSVIIGKLDTIYLESPFEKVLFFLRENLPYIEMLDNL